MALLETKYIELCNNPCDINEHLPTLKAYAQECSSVFETGVRGVVSSYALLYGLVENKNRTDKVIFLNDIEHCDIADFKKIAESNSVSVKYEWINNLDLVFSNNENYDLTFIDTFHVYPQLIRELNKFSQVTNKYIIMHDTTVDEFEGELIRNCGGYNSNRIDETSKNTGFSPEDLCKGLRPAIEEFLINNKNWQIKEVFTNNNGLTILEKLF